jgi:hypothetical protein
LHVEQFTLGISFPLEDEVDEDLNDPFEAAFLAEPAFFLLKQSTQYLISSVSPL